VPEQLLYSVEDAIEATQLGRTTLFSVMASGEIQSVKIGRRRMIPADALRDYVRGLVAKATEGADHATA